MGDYVPDDLPVAEDEELTPAGVAEELPGRLGDPGAEDEEVVELWLDGNPLLSHECRCRGMNLMVTVVLQMRAVVSTNILMGRSSPRQIHDLCGNCVALSSGHFPEARLCSQPWLSPWATQNKARGRKNKGL